MRRNICTATKLRMSGLDFPIPPLFWWSTDTILHLSQNKRNMKQETGNMKTSRKKVKFGRKKERENEYFNKKIRSKLRVRDAEICTSPPYIVQPFLEN